MTSKIQIATPVPPDDVADSKDFARAFEYIMLTEVTEGITQEEIAAHFGVSRQTIYAWVRNWTRSGLLKRIRKEYIAPVFLEKLESSYQKVMRDWDKVVDRQLATAISGRSDQFALQAASWLHETVIVPGKAEAEKNVRSEEMDYINVIKGSASALSPLSIGDEAES